MKLYYNLDKKDYINFNMNHIKTNKKLNMLLNFQRVVIAIAILLLASIVSKITGINTSVVFPFFIALTVFWVIAYESIFKIIMSKSLDKLLKEGKEKIILGERMLEFDEKQVLMITNSLDEAVNYEDIIDIKIDKEYVYIYITQKDAHIIPFRIFNSDGDKRKFLNFIKELNLVKV